MSIATDTLPHPNPGPDFTLGDRIRKARTNAGLDQAELAEKVGVSRQAVGSWERGRTVPSLPQSRSLAETLAVSLDWLAYGATDLRNRETRCISDSPDEAVSVPLVPAA